MKPKIKEGDFHKSINEAISRGQHAQYLREVLKQFDGYKRFFEKVFTELNDANVAYTFRANYLHKRLVWREIEILGKQTFFDLACMIIESMNWLNDHMHGFEFPRQNKKVDPYFTGSAMAFFAPGWEDDPHPTFKTDGIRICDLDYNKFKKLRFTFDYGDDHEFDIVFRGMRKADEKEKSEEFPRIVDQRGVGPEQYPEYE